jgi:hypothetical protein
MMQRAQGGEISFGTTSQILKGTENKGSIDL